MKQLISLVIVAIVLLCSCKNENKAIVIDTNEVIPPFPVPVEFPSLDSLIISANIYEISKDSPTIVLCHQARFNKYEYAGIAEKLNELGFNCIAIDQRSGGPICDKVNETSIRAVSKNKPTDYIDAEPDIIAAVEYAYKRYNKPVILWGSSYSSTLALYIAVESDNVFAVVSFSPGNYMSHIKGSLVDVLESFDKPIFVTSSRWESSDTKKLLQKMKPNEYQVFFAPNGVGHHGSRALWKTQSDGEEYWTAIENFLDNLGKYNNSN
jgi:dienelactone hydrolase